ncbi:MAG: hypothetical protein J5606_04550 [Bacteroidales bacterium]|jgi:hypothetical protein|nr:hypothetical protein [Bacteroidales bacterium]
MSQVYARNRNETELQFRVNAVDLQTELTTYLMKEKYLPKKWRYGIGYPLIAKADELVDNIIYANSIFPDSIEKANIRKQYITLAIANCQQIQNKIIRMIKCVETTKIEQMQKIIEKLTHEADLLIAWRKSTKIINTQNG